MQHTFLSKRHHVLRLSVYQGLGYTARGTLLLAVVYMALVLRSGTVLAVQTASMVPIFAPGDAVVIQRHNRQYEPGEVISYRSRKDPRQVISHRIVATDNKLQQLVTKGDNLHEPDPPIRNWDVLGRVVYVIPAAGHALNFLYTGLGLAVLVYLPALLVTAIEAHRLCAHKNHSYQLHGSPKGRFLTDYRRARYILVL